MPDFDLSAIDLPPWLTITLIFIASTGTMIVLKSLVVRQLARLINKTKFTVDTLLIQSISFPLTIVIIVVNLLVLHRWLASYSGANGELTAWVNTSTKVLLIFAFIIFLNRFIVGLLIGYAERSEGLRSSQSILLGVTHSIIFGIGLLVLLSTLGISITPIVASLGITSLAVALALQPTLENFFSGVQLVIDKPFRVGDFIELDSGEQGFVDRIGWRSTWIRMLPNNIVIMPNSLLSKSKVINYYYPEKELSVPVEVGVHYSSDLEKVEEVTLEVAREILTSHKWGVSTYETFVVFHTFDSSSINFTVMLRAQEYFNRFWIKSAFIKALHKRYAEEGIVIPYPIRAINTDQEKAKFQNMEADTVCHD